MYAIFKCNNNAKYEKLPYVNVNVKLSVKRNLYNYKNCDVSTKIDM